MPRDREFNDKHFEELAKSFAEGNRPFLDTDEIEDLIDYLLSNERRTEALAISDYAMSIYGKSTDLLIQRAIILIEYRRLEEAREILNYVNPLEPLNPDLHIAWGDLHVQDGDIDKGIECYDKAVKCEGKNQSYFETLLMIASRLNRDEQWQYVFKYTDLYLKKKPNDPNILFELAYAQDKCGEEEKSIETYLKMLELDPFSDSGWYNLALLWTRNGYYDYAEKAFEHAIALAPDLAEVYVNYGNLYQTTEQYGKSIEKYATYISLTQDSFDFDSSVYQLLIDSFHQWAIKECDKSSPEDDKLQINDEARDLFMYAIKLCSFCIENDIEAGHSWFILADISNSTGEYEQALDQIENSLHYDYNNACTQYLKAAICDNIGYIGEALFALNDAIMNDPTPTRGWLECAKEEFKYCTVRKVTDSPITMFESTLKYDKADPNCILSTCFLEYLCGKDNQKTYDKILKVKTEAPEIFSEAMEDTDFSNMMNNDPYINIIKEI